MTLQQLRYLIALDDHRHFGRAAKACFVAQPTLTTQVRKLEDELGQQIFDRASKPLRPTPLGQKILAQARVVLDEVAGLENMLEQETNQLSGTYTLGIIPTLAPYLLPLFVHPFSSKFPEVKLIIREMQSEQIIEGLQRQQLDLGLLVTPLEEKHLREIVLFHEPFLIYASPQEEILQQTPLLPEHLKQKDLWLLEQGHCFRNQVLNICSSRQNLSPAGEAGRTNVPFTFQAGSIETLKNLVRHNLGYTIIPEMSVHPELDRDHVKRFAEPQPAREVSLVVHKTFSREQLIKELRQEILGVIPPGFRKENRYFSVNWR
ncbi:MAG: hydrogen peroxide-inducible genes activator [Bacteroidota bacterium]